MTRVLSGAFVVALMLALNACGGDSGKDNSHPTTPAAPGERAKGPNLRVDAEAIAPSIELDERNFPPGDCAVEEKCVSGTGIRRLMKFEADIVNAGDQDFYMGNPANNPNYQFSPCHQHYHLQNMMEYALIDPSTGAPVAAGSGPVVARKQGFCLEDSKAYSAEAKKQTGSGKYECDNQGIRVGWEDVYDNAIDCQWLDITGVAPGTYILRLTVNPDRAYLETDYSDNVAEVPVFVD